VTNPYKCEVGNRLILGSSGQPINDMHSLCKQDDRLSILESCINWGHMAPTCPDTLRKETLHLTIYEIKNLLFAADTFPCFKSDPFIMEDCPDIFFAGNQPEYKTRIITGKVLLCLLARNT